MTTSIRLHISCDIFRHHNDNIIHQKKSFVNHFLSFPVPKALLNMLRSKNIIIISSVPSSMLTAGISCTHFTVTIVSIAIITAKASNAGTQQIILKAVWGLCRPLFLHRKVYHITIYNEIRITFLLRFPTA